MRRVACKGVREGPQKQKVQTVAGTWRKKEASRIQDEGKKRRHAGL